MTADQLANKAAAIKGNEEDAKTYKVRAMVAGATAGGVFGLYYGYTRKKSMPVMAVAGAIVGAVVSRLLTPSV